MIGSGKLEKGRDPLPHMGQVWTKARDGGPGSVLHAAGEHPGACVGRHWVGNSDRNRGVVQRRAWAGFWAKERCEESMVKWWLVWKKKFGIDSAYIDSSCQVNLTFIRTRANWGVRSACQYLFLYSGSFLSGVLIPSSLEAELRFRMKMDSNRSVY